MHNPDNVMAVKNCCLDKCREKEDTLKDFMRVRDERESGFSLVELLVVIVIIGILSAIAIAAFLNQRKKANDATVESDLRTVVTMVETMLVDYPNTKYLGYDFNIDEDWYFEIQKEYFDGIEGTSLYLKENDSHDPILTEQVFSPSEEVLVEVYTNDVHDGYFLAAFHLNGGKYNYDKAVNGGDVLTFDSKTGEFKPHSLDYILERRG